MSATGMFCATGLCPRDRGRKTRRSVLWLAILVALTSACGDDEAAPAPSGGRGLGGGAPPSGQAAAAGGGNPGQGGAQPEDEGPRRLEAVTYRDEDFVESERNRDPFRSYMTTFEVRAPEAVQRNVVMPTTAIESMRLIAVITGVPRPKAMLVDPLGTGHTVERGMYIGRPQVIQATGSVSMTLNWRVDRIRENEVVLTRQDPTDPSRPPLTRVIPLHEELAQR